MFPRDFGRRTQQGPRYYYDRAGRKVHLPYEVEEANDDDNGKKGGRTNAANGNGSGSGTQPHSRPRSSSSSSSSGDTFESSHDEGGSNGETSPRFFCFRRRYYTTTTGPRDSFGGSGGRASSSRFDSDPFFSSDGGYDDDDDDDDDDYYYDLGRGDNSRPSYRSSNRTSRHGCRVHFNDGSRPGDNSPPSGPGSFHRRKKKKHSRHGRSKPNSPRSYAAGESPTDTPNANYIPRSTHRHHGSKGHDQGTNPDVPDVSGAPDADDGVPTCSGRLRDSRDHKPADNNPNTDPEPESDNPNELSKHSSTRRRRSGSPGHNKETPGPSSHHPRRHHHHCSKHRQRRSPNHISDIPSQNRSGNSSNSRRHQKSHIPDMLSFLSFRGTSTTVNGRHHRSSGHRRHHRVSNARNRHERCDRRHRSIFPPFNPRTPRSPHASRFPPGTWKRGEPGTEEWLSPDYIPGSATCICGTCIEGHNRTSKPCLCDACAGEASARDRPLCRCGHNEALCTWAVYCELPGVSVDYPPYGIRLKCRECPFDVVKVSRVSRRAFGMPKIVTLRRKSGK